MLTVNVICVGKLKEKFYLAAVEEYSKRLSRSCKLNLLELPEERLPETPSDAQIEAALRKEFQLIQSKLPKGGVVIAMCIEGKTLSSAALAKKFNDWAVGGASQLTFLIGSSFGLHPETKALADFKLSMSPMTFPHHLARVMLLEQIYRAFQIQQGTKYHK